MGAADHVARRYFGHPLVFADIFNSLCFKGKPVVTPEELVEVPLNVTACNLKGKYADFSRDLLMRMTCMDYKDSTLVLLGLEHQSYVNYAMPLRCMHYDVLTLLNHCYLLSLARENS